MKPAVENYEAPPLFPRFCNDRQDLYKVATNNPFRKMVGGANPKTQRVPIVENRPMDLDAWRDDDRVRDSRTNNPRSADLFLSGYTTTSGYPVNCNKNPRNLYPRYDTTKEHFSVVNYQTSPQYPELPPKGERRPQYVVEPLDDQEDKPQLTPCQSQINVNLPSNFAFANCPNDERMNHFNKQVFTQNIGPDASTQSEIVEPINSNYGITDPIQLRPTVVTKDWRGGNKYLELDPDIPREIGLEVEENFMEPRYDNVFDPRGSGYGTSYRSYVEPTTGQPRFYYDDVNAIRMPNYIARSKVDFLPYADTYGQQRDAPEDMNGLVQHDWLKNTNDFREDLMRSLMRKRNSEMWQLRVAPLGPRRC